MKKIIFCLTGLLILLLLMSCSNASSRNDELRAKIDEYLSRAAKTGFSGALLVAKGGEIILSKGYGLANRGKNIPVTSQTIFTVGSITKQFTATAILKLRMMGRLDVNDPITKYFKDVPEDKQKITLHHLLTHTAGFPGAIGDDFEPISRDEFIKLAMKTKLLHQPGEKYRYSNVGYSLLGAIVEIVSGKSYEAFLHDHLFQPAGITKTGYLLPRWDRDELAHGYRGDRDWGTLLDKPWADDGPYWHLRANGGILSNVEDMYRWHLALLGNKILSEEAKQALYTPYVPEGEDAESYYGYGWAIFATPRNTRLVAHNGGNTIFAADFLRYLDEDVVIIIMSNTAGKSAIRISPDIARIVFGYDYRLPPEKIETLSKDDLPKSAMGRRALALLKIYAGQTDQTIDAFLDENFSPQFIKRATRARLIKIIQHDRNEIGRTSIGRVVRTDGNTLELTVQSRRSGAWWLITLEFEAQQPHRITRLGVVDTFPAESEMIREGTENLNARWGLPNSHTGRRSAALLEAIDRSDISYAQQFIETNFAPDFLKAFSMAEHLEQFRRMHKEIGKLTLSGAMKTGPYSARLKVHSIRSGQVFNILLKLESEEPYRIVGIEVMAEKNEPLQNRKELP